MRYREEVKLSERASALDTLDVGSDIASARCSATQPQLRLVPRQCSHACFVDQLYAYRAASGRVRAPNTHPEFAMMRYEEQEKSI